jgi:hypothetical protein
VARPALRALGQGETRVFGQLTAIECGRSEIVLVATVDGAPMRVSAPRFEDVDFVTYRQDLSGRIECGSRSPSDPVLLTFRSAAGAGTGRVAVAVEFVPRDYRP